MLSVGVVCLTIDCLVMVFFVILIVCYLGLI